MLVQHFVVDVWVYWDRLRERETVQCYTNEVFVISGLCAAMQVGWLLRWQNTDCWWDHIYMLYGYVKCIMLWSVWQKLLNHSIKSQRLVYFLFLWNDNVEQRVRGRENLRKCVDMHSKCVWFLLFYSSQQQLCIHLYVHQVLRAKSLS